jgi:hypothetical protein
MPGLKEFIIYLTRNTQKQESKGGCGKLISSFSVKLSCSNLLSAGTERESVQIMRDAYDPILFCNSKSRRTHARADVTVFEFPYCSSSDGL